MNTSWICVHFQGWKARLRDWAGDARVPRRDDVQGTWHGAHSEVGFIGLVFEVR